MYFYPILQNHNFLGFIWMYIYRYSDEKDEVAKWGFHKLHQPPSLVSNVFHYPLEQTFEDNFQVGKISGIEMQYRGITGSLSEGGISLKCKVARAN